jgi:hypothetical protein
MVSAGAVGKELDMKRLIFGLLAAASIGAVALPASAQVVVREHRNGAVTVRPAYSEPAYRHHYRDHYRGHHYRHRVVWFDRWGHRHVDWR